MKPILSSLGLVTVGDESAWAVTSPDDRYRYILGRTWDPYFQEQRGLLAEPTRPLWVFGMINPSDARVEDDPTIRKCTGFAKRGGAGGYLVVNMLAYSHKNPAEIVRLHKQGVDVRGEHNAEAMQWALSRPALLGRHIAAWGRVPPKLRELAKPGIMQFLCSNPDCFGLNEDGSPKHPLMLSYRTPIVSLRDARAAA